MGWWEVWIQRFHPRRSSTEEAPKGVIDLAAVSFAALLSVFFAHESFSYRSGERSSGRRDGAARNARRTHRLVRPQTSLFLQNVGSSDLEGKEGRGGRRLKEGGGLQWSCISRRRQRLDQPQQSVTGTAGSSTLSFGKLTTPPHKSHANFTTSQTSPTFFFVRFATAHSDFLYTSTSV